MQQIQVSVIVPIHNTRESFLRDCLDSIVNQTIQNIQVILVDDGSETNGKIADLYADKDTRIEVVHQKNKGVSLARNVGISRIKGKYTYFVDQDDWLAPNALEKMHEAAVKNNADCVAIDGVLVRENGRFIKIEKPPYRQYKEDDWTGNANYQLFIKSDILMNSERARFPGGSCFAEDTAFSFIVLSYANKKTYLEEALYYYRHHEKMNTNLISLEHKEKFLLHCQESILSILKFLNAETSLQKKRKIAFFEITRTLLRYIYLNSSISIWQYMGLIKFIKSKTKEYTPVYSFPKFLFYKDMAKGLMKKIERNTIRKFKLFLRGSKKKELSIFYFNPSDINNFGDALNPILIEKLFSIKNHIKDANHAKLFAIGSILQNLYCKKKYRFISFFQRLYLPAAHIWSSGLITPPARGCRLKRKIKIFALRGHYTRDILQCHTKQDLSSIPLGDAGLLASDLLIKIPSEAHRVGIIPHLVDEKNELISDLIKLVPGSTLINICGDPFETLNKIASCGIILSSSMHGLIAADSLGIPNQWIKFSDEVIGNDFKFKDYYSVYGLEPKAWDLRMMKVTAADVLSIPKNYQIKRDHVEKIKRELKQAFPF